MWFKREKCLLIVKNNKRKCFTFKSFVLINYFKHVRGKLYIELKN